MKNSNKVMVLVNKVIIILAIIAYVILSFFTDLPKHRYIVPLALSINGLLAIDGLYIMLVRHAIDDIVPKFSDELKDTIRFVCAIGLIILVIATTRIYLGLR